MGGVPTEGRGGSELHSRRPATGKKAADGSGPEPPHLPASQGRSARARTPAPTQGFTVPASRRATDRSDEGLRACPARRHLPGGTLPLGAQASAPSVAGAQSDFPVSVAGRSCPPLPPPNLLFLSGRSGPLGPLPERALPRGPPPRPGRQAASSSNLDPPAHSESRPCARPAGGPRRTV